MAIEVRPALSAPGEDAASFPAVIGSHPAATARRPPLQEPGAVLDARYDLTTCQTLLKPSPVLSPGFWSFAHR